MNNEALDILKHRRSIRKYKGEQIKDAELAAVLEAGTYGATGMGSQSPHIVAVQNSELIKQLSAMNAEVMGRPGTDPYYGAPTIVFVFADPSASHTPDEDAIIVASNVLNAAYAVGLGSCWINRSKEMFESEAGKKLMEEWGIPEQCYSMSSIAVGYADEEPEAKPRKDDYITIIK